MTLIGKQIHQLDHVNSAFLMSYSLLIRVGLEINSEMMLIADDYFITAYNQYHFMYMVMSYRQRRDCSHTVVFVVMHLFACSAITSTVRHSLIHSMSACIYVSQLTTRATFFLNQHLYKNITFNSLSIKGYTTSIDIMSSNNTNYNTTTNGTLTNGVTNGTVVAGGTSGNTPTVTNPAPPSTPINGEVNPTTNGTVTTNGV